MTTRKFLAFNVSFWLLAAVVLFLNSWTRAHGHLDVAITRYVYFVLIGLWTTATLTLSYKSSWFEGSSKKLLWVTILSISSGLLMAIILNPITYLMIGAGIHSVGHEILSTDTLYFALFYIVWSALYFQLSGGSLISPALAEKPHLSRTFKVESRGEKRVLQDNDIDCVIASGDYVELITAANAYLKKETLSNLEDQLDSARFMRVHRSTIVNIDKISSIIAKGEGCFEITLAGGRKVQSSRSYKAVVEGLFPKG